MKLTTLTNAEIANQEAHLKNHGQREQVSQMIGLRKSHQLVWSGNAAEIRDTAANDKVIYSGTLAECEAEASRLGLSY